MLSSVVNQAVKDLGHPELALSPSEARIIDILARGVEKYIWLIFALIVAVIILPRIVIILRASRGK